MKRRVKWCAALHERTGRIYPTMPVKPKYLVATGWRLIPCIIEYDDGKAAKREKAK